MSSSDDGDDSGPGTREVAHRVFAAEFDDADFDYSESDEERAPNYVVTPTGLRANRLFAVGVLTEVESVNEQTLRGRVVDPTGAFVTYAGQYQPDEAAFLDRTTPPAFVALTGKARTFEPDDADVVYTSVRPESFATVDAETRDRWVVSAARATLRRVATFARALELEERGDRLRDRLEAADVPTALASGIPLAIDHYDTGTRYLEAVRGLAADALEVVADEREEVRALDASPADRGGGELGPLPDVPYDLDATAAPEPDEDGDAADADATDGEASADTVTTAEADETEATPADADAGATAAVDDPGVIDDSTGGADAADAGTDDDVERSVDPVDTPGDAGGADDLGDFDDADGPGAFDAGEGTTVDGGDEPPADGDADDGEPPEDLEDADPEEFEDVLSEEERREVEEEHGVEFATGSSVPDPGEAGMDTADTGATEPDEDRDVTGELDTEPSPSTAGTEPASEDRLDASAPDDSGDPYGESDAEDLGVDAAAPDSDDAADAVDDPAAEADPAEQAVMDDPDADADVDESAGADAADVDLEEAVVAVMEELDDGDGVGREEVVAATVDRHGADPGDAESAIQDALMSGKCYEPADGTLKPI